MIPKSEQARWTLQEAAIKAEINQAKTNLDLLRMANAIAKLDELHAEIAARKSTSVGSDNRKVQHPSVDGT